MKKFAKFIASHSVLILVISFLLLVPAIYGYVNTRINYDILVYLPDSVDTIKGENILTDDFGLGAYAFVMVDSSNNKKILDLEKDIKKIEGVSAVVSIADATDTAQIEELITLGELTKRAWEKDVQVMIEGPGHMPLNQIAANMEIQKTLCHGAPFYVLGPLVTDVAPGYDHITSAIGGAIAAYSGAAFLCYVTPAEHLRLPNAADVKEGIIAAKIAAHAADIAKGVPGAAEWDYKMSEARKRLDWEEMFKLSMDPEKARRYRAEAKPEKEDTCSMCGNFCAVKNTNRILDGEIVTIFDE